MRILRRFMILCICVISISILHVESAQAQCAMCTLTAENATKDGNTQGKGLNDGILFLLAIPYLIAGGIGYLWYKKYRNAENERKATKIL